MTKTIVWDDGTVLSAETDDELVAKTESHLLHTHPQIAGHLSREEILAMARSEPEQGTADHGPG